jgi:hypothetical protein
MENLLEASPPEEPEKWQLRKHRMPFADSGFYHEKIREGNGARPGTISM